MCIFFSFRAAHSLVLTLYARALNSKNVMTAYVSMIYVVNSPKLAYLWSLMSEVKCVMRNQPYTHTHAPLTKKKNEQQNTKWTQTFHTTSTVYAVQLPHELNWRKKKTHHFAKHNFSRRDVLIFRSIELFALENLSFHSIRYKIHQTCHVLCLNARNCANIC